MHILALESSGTGGSIALLRDSEVQAQMTLPRDRRTAQTLAPSVQWILDQTGWRPGHVELIGVTHGPGSFTGLRIGVTTAKAFAYAVGARVAGVNTLHVLAHQVPKTIKTVTSLLDAQRRQLFSATYERLEDGRLITTTEPHISDIDPWLRELKPGSAVIGSGLRLLCDRLPSDIHVVEEATWEPRAATVGLIAWQMFQAGHPDELWTLAPKYLRASAAEEKGTKH